MQETAIADGVGERLSLEGDPVFEAPQTPYKKMPSASKAIEDVKSSTALSVPFVKRPPHNLAIIYLPFLSSMH